MSDRSDRGKATAAVARGAVTKSGKDGSKAAADQPPVDVDALLTSIRSRLDGAEASKPDGEGAVETVTPASVPATLPEEALARSFEMLKRAGPLDPRAPIESHRAVVGPLVVAFKSVLRRLLSPAFSSLFDHQAGFDRATLSYADELYRRVVGMEADLRTRLERIEARQALELETIERRLARLEGGASGERARRDDG
jgi:hypothetical protein